MKSILRIIGSLLVLFIVFVSLGKGGHPLENRAGNGRFAPCPDSPNCVSTQSDRDGFRMNPIPTGSRNSAAVVKIVGEIIKKQERAEIVEATADYLRAEFKSKVFGFVDDVEFYHDADQGLLHFKSASRIGYFDMGVNRKRMEQLTVMILEALNK